MTSEPKTTIEGFTLLEVLVAFMILAMALGVALQTINLGTRSIAAADEKRAVLELAEALRAERLDDPTLLEEGTLGGQDRTLEWNMSLVGGPETSSATQTRSNLVILQIHGGSLGAKRYDFLLHRASAADD